MLSEKSIKELESLSSKKEYNYLFGKLNKPLTDEEKKVVEIITNIIIRECMIESKYHAFVRSMVHMASRNNGEEK